MEKTSSRKAVKRKGSIELNARYRDPAGTIWRVVEPCDAHISDKLGYPVAWLTDVERPDRERYMRISELSAQLSDDWEVL